MTSLEQVSMTNLMENIEKLGKGKGRDLFLSEEEKQNLIT